MSADGPLFWMLMGMVTVLTGGALRSFAQRRGWVMTWWKWVLVVLWYALLSTTFYAAGTLVGELETRAALRVLLVGLFVSLVLGVGLGRVLAHRGGSAASAAHGTGEA